MYDYCTTAKVQQYREKRCERYLQKEMVIRSADYLGDAKQKVGQLCNSKNKIICTSNTSMFIVDRSRQHVSTLKGLLFETSL